MKWLKKSAETIEFKEDVVQKYLDTSIGLWRKTLEEVENGEDKLKAECYIDAFQSVRTSLFGETKPKEKEEIK